MDAEPIVIISLKEVAKRTSLSPTRIKSLDRLGKFPARNQLTEMRIGYLLAEVEEWIAGRVAARGTIQPSPKAAHARAARKPRAAAARASDGSVGTSA